MRTLVACPVGRKRDYSLPHWAAATEGYERAVAIDDAKYADRVEHMGIRVLRFPTSHPWVPRCFNDAWRTITHHAEEEGFTHILSLESDIIAPPHILKVMEREYEGGFLCHHYPFRKPRQGMCAEMGCTLASTELWRKALSTCPAGVAVYDWFRLSGKFEVQRIEVVELLHMEQEPLLGSDPRKQN